MGDLVAARRPFIDGRWPAGEGPALPVHSPATEELVAMVEGASAAQTEAAIRAARTTFDHGGWPQLAAKERIEAVGRLGDALDARRNQLIETVIQEAGSPRALTEVAQVGMALQNLREFADLYGRLPEWEYNEVPLSDQVVGGSVRLSIRRYEAAGVVAAITPYNFPFVTNIWKIVPALLAGCTAVLRPSPLTPLSALVFGEAAEEAELPPGVLNVVAETGNEGGVLLSTHEDVDVVSFTGSTTVGRSIVAQAAATLKRVIVELGGKSVQIHLPDSFDEGAGSTIGPAMMVLASHAGQGCALQARMLVPEAHRADVVDAVAAAATSLSIGDPTDPANVVGPLISCAQRARVHEIVESALVAGARLVTGGRQPPSLPRGWFYEPTVVDAPTSSNPAAQREIFGPVLTILGYRTVDEAVAIANDSDLGLSGGVYTSDLALGLSVAERIRTGTVQINTGLSNGYTPAGGYKQSGYGHERGVAGFRSFQELKHVVVGSR